jgi:membrane-bound metal-dependent hydrolase YbcI (DUF457 family)
VPITPFHFGPGALLHAVAPRRISFIAFCTANVLTDVEPLYYMLAGEAWLHRFFHTWLGASVMSVAVVLLFLGARWYASMHWLPNVCGWRALALPPVAFGAVLGCATHVLLDSVMHADMHPFAPFSDANPLWRVVALGTLHWSCVAAGAIGLIVLAVRSRSLTHDT